MLRPCHVSNRDSHDITVIDTENARAAGTIRPTAVQLLSAFVHQVEGPSDGGQLAPHEATGRLAAATTMQNRLDT